MNWICLLVLMFIQPGVEVVSQELDTSSESLSDSFDPDESWGLFVGIRNFVNFAELPYAVDDAVDMAFLYSIELGVVPAKNMVLMIQGDPEKEVSKERLKYLTEEQGVHVIRDVSRSALLEKMKIVVDKTGVDGLALFSFSSHGLHHGFASSDPTGLSPFYFVMPETNRPEIIQNVNGEGATGKDYRDTVETSFRLSRIVEQIGSNPIGGLAVFIDACRLKVKGRDVDSIYREQTIEEPVEEPIKQPVMLAFAASFGQISNSDEERKNGRFTASVIEVCRSDAESRSLLNAGLISTNTENWMLEEYRWKETQTPVFHFGGDFEKRSFPVRSTLSDFEQWKLATPNLLNTNTNILTPIAITNQIVVGAGNQNPDPISDSTDASDFQEWVHAVKQYGPLVVGSFILIVGAIFLIVKTRNTSNERPAPSSPPSYPDSVLEAFQKACQLDRENPFKSHAIFLDIAKNHSYAPAMQMLGDHYRKPAGVMMKSADEAMIWYRKAAEQKLDEVSPDDVEVREAILESQYRLGRMLIEQNAEQRESAAYQEGMEWIVKARGGNHHDAEVYSQKVEGLRTL